MKNKTIKPSEEELAFLEKEYKKDVDATALKESKKRGKNYNGFTIPFTSSDALAVLQVKAAFDYGTLKTVLYFSNGVKMPITKTNFATFAEWFTTERNKFFIQ